MLCTLPFLCLANSLRQVLRVHSCPKWQDLHFYPASLPLWSMSCCARECGDLQHIYSKLLESQSKVVGSHGFSSVFWGIPMPFPHNDCSIVHAYPQCPGVPFPLHPLQPPQPSADNRHSSNWKVILLMWTWISISLMTSGSKHFVIHHWDSHVYFWEVPTFARFSTEVFSPSWTWAFWVPQILTPLQTYVLLMFPPLMLVLSLLSWGTEWMSLDDLQLVSDLQPHMSIVMPSY